MILLTSPSPRRRELLQQIGLVYGRDFIQTQGSSTIIIRNDDLLTLDEVKERILTIAEEKVTNAINVGEVTKWSQEPSRTVVVGTDTVVFVPLAGDSRGNVCDRPSMINPGDFIGNRNLDQQISEEGRQKAKKMLEMESGKKIYILTALVATCAEKRENSRSICVVTEATMKSLTDDDIERYLKTGEPLDKAGAFAIQGKGTILFEQINGSYSNIVGLPLKEFVDLLNDPLFKGRFDLHLSEKTEENPIHSGPPELRVVSIGDINYDLIYNEFAPGFFASLHTPGQHMLGRVRRNVGGTATNFAKYARQAGFKQSAVLGVIGGDALGRDIEESLHDEGIRTLIPVDYSKETSIALILSDCDEHDTKLTLTDAQQALSVENVDSVRTQIEKAHVIYISGYALTDPDRRQATIKAMEYAKRANCLVVLDVTVDMDQTFTYDQFLAHTRNNVDLLVTEISTVLNWLDDNTIDETDWDAIKKKIIPELKKVFPAFILRTSNYSHQFIVSPSSILGPCELDYSSLPQEERIGYADKKTINLLGHLLSPRILLASKSPRRLALLRQIADENKIEVLVTNELEEYFGNEDPKERVCRLAKAKANNALAHKNEYSASIEFIIGADTEIVIDNRVIENPGDNKEKMRAILKMLSGKTHEAITGVTILHIRDKGKIGEFSECVTTRISFKSLTEDEIEDYIQSGEPVGKAGGYGIQGKGAVFIEKMEGSYSNVVGLPLERLTDILKMQFGTSIWTFNKVSDWILDGFKE